MCDRCLMIKAMKADPTVDVHQTSEISSEVIKQLAYAFKLNVDNLIERVDSKDIDVKEAAAHMLKFLKVMSVMSDINGASISEWLIKEVGKN